MTTLSTFAMVVSLLHPSIYFLPYLRILFLPEIKLSILHFSVLVVAIHKLQDDSSNDSVSKLPTPLR